VNRHSVLILAPFVTLEAGTGAVHIAPGHGQEDYEIGLEYGLDNYAPVDDAGKFTEDVEHFAGQFVFDANDNVIKKLDEVGALLGHVPMQHSYPHCWRCKKPIIFRSTEQWFISMEKNDLRKKALACINEVKWIPSWGRDRIYGMVENRPDWCISRQRLWGVPITVFYCAKCKNEVMTQEIMDYLVGLVDKDGADVWFEKEPKDLMPKHTTCPHCHSTEFTKEINILDVWFDSGVTHAAVLEKRPDLSSPCDMYLEGSDQHRGWFHSSLLECVGTRGRAPYKSVLTHGFVVDGEGKKMSKSVGNVIGAEEAIAKYGAEILRLWVAAEDYTDDIRISDEILKRLMEAYRRIRNTSRFILGNLYDFNLDKDAVPYEQMMEMDKWALHRLQEVIKRVTEAYERHQFHVVFYTLYNYCTVDLSALYLDVLKDRLYTNKAASNVRRSGQTAMFILLDSMTRLLAPVLTFTSEEVWSAMPAWHNKEESVHLAQFPQVNEKYFNAELGDRWKAMIDAKSEIAKAVEQARKEKTIGHSLDARITIAAPQKLRELIATHIEDMRSLLIVSQLQLADEKDIVGPFRSAEIEGLAVGVEKARGGKCERCWIYEESVGADANHPTVCARCLPNL
jgi:isoleucyl-tRNA synthetase